MIYFDTSYLVKCYLPEPGFEAVRLLAEEGEHPVCSAIGRLELMAAMHRKFREGTLSDQGFNAIIRQIELDESRKVIQWFPVTSDLLENAWQAFRDLPREVFLRSADALHLTCARDRGFERIYSSDQHLLKAAPLFGLTGLNILA